MTTKLEDQAADYLAEIKELMSLNGDNPFKIRAFEKAEPMIRSTSGLKERAEKGQLTELSGIGKGIEEILNEFILKGKTSARDTLKASLPAGLLELVQVPGLGPKKAKKIIEELSIQTLGELQYACKENRLLLLDGFGEKAQSKILEGVEFLLSTQNQCRWVDAVLHVENLIKQIKKTSSSVLEAIAVGAYRRKLEVLENLEFLIVSRGELRKIEKKANEVVQAYKNKCLLPIKLFFCEPDNLGSMLVKTTGTKEHVAQLKISEKFKTEEEVYKKNKHYYIAPEMRESALAIEMGDEIGDVLPEKGAIRGIFHFHTTQSDGDATLEEMIKASIALGYEYIGVSDHSQSAFYAQGLKEDQITVQLKEIEKLRNKYPEIVIFSGIESDILSDGSLDYPEKVLKKFDFVIGSIHSRFKMGEEAMTARLIKAIENPYTTFIGHPTGRLILGRKPYPLQMDKVLKAATKNHVIMEINAHPSRLDLDWRYGELIKKNKTLVSIHPDAHSIEGLQDTQYGVVVARKALLPKQQVFNSRSASEVSEWIKS